MSLQSRSKCNDRKITKITKIGMYTVLNEIASTPNSIVYKVADTKGMLYAAKVIDWTPDEVGIPGVLEADIMTRLRHDNLVPAVVCYNSVTAPEMSEDSLAIIMPLYVDSLYHFVRNRDDFRALSWKIGLIEYKEKVSRNNYLKRTNWETIISLMHNLTEAVLFLHSRNILHLDIKLANCLVSSYEHARVVLTDFGLSTLVITDNISLPEEKITAVYRAPEQLYQCILQPSTNPVIYAYSDKSDIWALGITFFELLTITTFHDRVSDNYFKHIKNSETSISTYSDESILECIKRLFSVDNRIKTLTESLNHLPELYKADAIELLNGIFNFDHELRWGIDKILQSRLFLPFRLMQICSPVQSIKRKFYPSPKSFPDIYSIGITFMRDIYKREYAHLIYRLVFLAYDLYHKGLVYFDETYGDHNLDNDKYQEKFYTFILACMLLANKTYNIYYVSLNKYIDYLDILNAANTVHILGYENETVKIHVKKSELRDMEKTLIEYFDYHINQRIPVDYFVTINQVILFMPYMKSPQYNTVDISEFTKKYRPNIEDFSQPLMGLTIGDINCL